MASLFNQKEEVISLELTKYGKKCIGSGVFQPSYYSFFDNSVIYDNSYFGVDESINYIQERILNNSITFKCLNLSDNNTKKFKYKDLLGEPVGSSNIFSDYAPAWKIEAYKKNITLDEDYKNSYYEKQFNIDTIEYITKKRNDDSGDYIFSDKEYILLDIQEINVEDDTKNFDIELIMLNDDGTEKKLMFHQLKNNIINDIIFDETELPSGFFEYEVTPDDAAFYFDVQADQEIDITIDMRTGKPVVNKVPADSTIKTTYDGAVGEEC